MELIERYLQAIGRFLPAEPRADILAELRSELEEQMDARAAEWGRPLDEADVAALLKMHGKPEAVALRYLPQRSLIGPASFPIYWYTLQRVLPLVAIVYVIGNAATMLLSPSHGDVAGQIIRAVFGLIPALFICWGIVTIAFAIIEYARHKPSLRASLGRWDPAQWDPSKLPSIKPQAAKEKSFNVRLFELGLHILWMVYVLAIPTHLFLVLGPGAHALQSNGIALAPVWGTFYAILIAVLSVQLIMRIVALRPSGQPWVKPLDLASRVIGIVGISLLAFGPSLLIASSAIGPNGIDPQKLAGLNHGLTLAFRITVLVSVFGFGQEAWKYLRHGGSLRRHALTV